MIAKKWISALLTAAVMTAALAGCGGQAVPEETAAGQTLAAAAEEKPEPVEVKAGVFYYYGQDAFISKLQDSVDTALEEAGIAYENYDAGNDQETQMEQIREAIDGGCNLLIVNLVVSIWWTRGLPLPLPECVTWPHRRKYRSSFSTGP